MNSAEIAQMLSAQNSMFLGQRSYAQNIGLPTGGGGFQRSPDAPGAPPVWNAGPGSGMAGPGMGGGNAFAGGMMSAAGAAGTVGMLGIGGLSMMSRMSGGFGTLGKAASVMDPFSMGMAGFRGAGLMGGLAGAAAPLALAGGAAMMGHHFMQGGQQQQMVGQQLQQFQQFNPNSRTGQGFSRDDAQAIGSSMRSMAHLPEMMTSMEELTKLLPKLKQSGMMQGVRDATEFAQRFKESVKTIRDVSKVLGTTMEDATSFFAHSRSVGFLGKQAGLQNAMNVQYTAGVTGMTNGQVVDMQQSGASMSRSMGSKGSLGATAVTNMAQALGRGQQSGAIKEGALEDMTGLTGDEAKGAAALRFSSAIAGIARSTAAGRLSVAGMTKFDESGKAIGIDEDLVARYREGSLSKAELSKRVSSRTRAQKISFIRREADLGMDFAGKVGPQGMAQFLENVAGARIGSEGVGVLLQRQGMSIGESDIMQGMVGQGGGEAELKSMMTRRAREAMIKERTDPSAIFKRLKTRAHSSVFGGVEEMGARVFTDIGKAYDEFVDDLVGRHIITISKRGSEDFARAMTAGGQAELKKMFASKAPEGARVGAGNSAFGKALRVGAGVIGGTLVGAATGGNVFLGAAAGAGISKGVEAGLDYLGSGESEIGALFTRSPTSTGRTAVGELKYSKGLYGSSSGEQLNEGIKGFIGANAASNALETLRDNIGNFRNMDEGRKRDELRSAVQSQINSFTHVSGMGEETSVETGEDAMRGMSEEDIEKKLKQMESTGGASQASLIRAGRAFKAKTGSKDLDLATASMAAAQSGLASDSSARVNFLSSSASSANQFATVALADNGMKAAASELSSLGMSSETTTALKERPEIRKAIRMALQNDPAVKEAILTTDSVKAMKMLAERGINLKAEDLETLRAAYAESKADGKSAVVLKAMGSYEDAENFKDKTALRNSAANMASELATSGKTLSDGGGGQSVTELSTALGALASDPSKEGALEEVQSKISNLTKAISEAKPGAKRNALIAAAGRFGEIAGKAVSKGSQLRGEMTAEQVAKTLGVTYDENSQAALKGAGISLIGTTKMDKSHVLAAEQAIAKARGTGVLGEKGTGAAAGDKDEAIVKAMKAFQDNMGLQNELLTMLTSGKATKEQQVLAAGALRASDENTPSNFVEK